MAVLNLRRRFDAVALGLCIGPGGEGSAAGSKGSRKVVQAVYLTDQTCSRVVYIGLTGPSSEVMGERSVPSAGRRGALTLTRDCRRSMRPRR